jgi:hypothetical protein
MTRRGSLAYYLSAWILGCFFMGLAVWIRDATAATPNFPMTRSAFGLLFFYFYGLVFGAGAALIGAWVLRVTMRALKCKNPLHWAAAGSVLSLGLMAALGIMGERILVAGRGVESARNPAMWLLGYLTFGPKIVFEAGWWLAIPGGAATAYFLCRIHRAFG